MLSASAFAGELFFMFLQIKFFMREFQKFSLFPRFSFDNNTLDINVSYDVHFISVVLGYVGSYLKLMELFYAYHCVLIVRTTIEVSMFKILFI